MKNNKEIIVTVLLLLVSILFFNLNHIDFIVQDIFYNFETKQWLLDKHTEPYSFIFYTGIKKLLILFAVCCLILFFFSRKNTKLIPYKKGLLIVILSAILVPVITGGIKRYSNMPCPKNEIHYGGTYPHTAVWESYTKPYTHLKDIKCWPAGHASGGFALMSLFFLFRRKRNKYLALSSAIVIGWSMGIYKMFIGDHFFSHTLITMFLAWLIILIIVKSVDFLKIK